MKMINNKRYYTSREVAEMVLRTTQTVVNWDKYSKILEERGENRLIPAPLMIGDKRYWNDEDLKKIIRFRDSIRPGMLSEFSVRMWGERGRQIRAKYDKLSDSQKRREWQLKKARFGLK